MKSQVDRPYLEAWEAVKKASELKVTYAHFNLDKSLHKRFMQGLRRESMRDRAFRFRCIENGKSFEIGYNSIGDMLQVYFRWKPYVTPSFVRTNGL